jgi:5,10-methylenetetrahydromethanopterin reductase
LSNGAKIVGFGIAPFASSSETLRYALLAEKYGLHSFWLGEGYHGRSAIALLSAIASQTRKIILGTSIIGVYTRHPALIAMEAATIDELSGGRFILGLGVNVSSLVKHGLVKSASQAKEQKPYSAMKDSVSIIRSLMGGETVVYHGEVFHMSEPGSTLNFHGFVPVRKDLPIYIGSRSPKILELSGRICDGVILSRAMSASGSYVKQCIAHVEEGARKAGRTIKDLIIAANLTLSVDKDSQRAKEHVRGAVALYVADPTLTATDLMVQHSKVKPEDLDLVKQGFAKGGIRQAAKLLTPEMIDEFSIAGTPDECLSKLERLAQLGIQIPIAFDILGPNPEVAIELISKEIEPRLLAGG